MNLYHFVIFNHPCILINFVLVSGGFGVDFSKSKGSVKDGLKKVARGILAHGVTSFCPTMISSPKEAYHKVIYYTINTNL